MSETEQEELKPLKVDPKNLRTVSTYAEEVGLTRQAIYDKINSGTLKSIKVGGVLFVDLS